MVPGSKTEGKTIATADLPRKRATQARIDVEDGVDSVQNATKSMNGENWDAEFSSELEIANTDDGDTELNAEDARSYRAIAARLHYISPDRPDIGFAVKEPARNMSKPRAFPTENMCLRRSRLGWLRPISEID